MYQTLLLLHVIAGTGALLSFWTAGLARKGGWLHVRAGRVFFISMCGIGATALPMAVILGLRGQIITATFLFLLLLLTTSACLTGWRSLRLKRDANAYRGGWYRALTAATLLGSLVVLAIGLHLGQVLLIGFSAFGIYRGLCMVRFLRRTLSPHWWLTEHYGSMLGNGVATHIAFLSIGLNRLLPAAWADSAHLLAWFGPLAVMFAARLWLDRRYGERKPLTAAGPTPSSGT
ncbi:hypothetical protein [Solimonas marina]|uniref:DUF2306 domain-containing protein n=1 Tax=Solimonas marina TaxID=2714601 RepID=A0A969W931_9GAMM|nr:hypothetical protein [Solimonas marina]NKF21181.1 hypothetical protein [Solimonas marina]